MFTEDRSHGLMAFRRVITIYGLSERTSGKRIDAVKEQNEHLKGTAPLSGLCCVETAQCPRNDPASHTREQSV